MRCVCVLALVIACGSATPAPEPAARGTKRVFGGSKDFEPVAFEVEVSGSGRPVIFVPGLGCPGEVWRDVVAELDGEFESHVLTLAGFAGTDPIDEPLSAAVRRDLTRYIRAKNLRDPIVVGHSMGGFIAYWIASAHPDLVGGVVIVDASPALSGGFEEAKTLRDRWKNASDEEHRQLLRAAFMSMTAQKSKMAKTLDKIIASDRRTIGEAIFEMVVTDLRADVKDITAPVLIFAADGGLQHRIKSQTAAIPNHHVVILQGTRHFVMWDDLSGFLREFRKFAADLDDES